MWKKGATCFWEGRAYDYRWINAGDTRWFRFKTKRTMLKGAMSVHVCFNKCPVNGWKIRKACCNNCQAGKHTGFCHHIVVGLEGLVAILAGLILAGDVNSGKMHWGLKQSNDERHHVPTILLNILAGNECMTTYRGSHKSSFESCMYAFNMEVFDHFGPRHPLLMTQELYSPELISACVGNTQSQVQKLRQKHRHTYVEEGQKRRKLHRSLVSDQCSVNDGIDLRRSVKSIKALVEKASPTSLNKIYDKESLGKSRKNLLKIIQKRKRDFN